MAPVRPLFRDDVAARCSRAPLLASTAMALTLAVAPPAQAAPETPTVVSGAVTVSTTGAAGAQTQTITQTGNRAIVSWVGFNLTKDDVVTFEHPNSRAVTVNRVSGPGASTIDGTINANGRVFVINPSGVVFGSDAKINVNTLIASTADITEQNLNADRYIFDQPGTVAGAVVSNAGQITVADTGMAGLFGPNVINTGTIIASVGTTHGGAIALGAGRAFSVDFAGDGLITFDVTAGVEAGDFTLPPTDLISNAAGGVIQANGGSVVMTALQASAIVDSAINIGGTVAANSVSTRNGLIELDGRGGDVTVSGTVRALGDNAGERGGRITIGGDSFTAASGAVIDVSGIGAPGGTIQAGTSATGTGDPLRTIAVNAGATIRASGTNGAIAGQMRLAASQSLALNGTIAAVSTNGTGGGVTLAAPAITLGTNITTSNVAVTLSGATALASDVTINTGAGNVSFAGTVNGPQALTVNSNGVTSFSGVVGGTTPLTSLTTNQGGSVTLVGAVTAGQQNYADAVTLTGTYTSAGGFNASGRDAGSVLLNGTTNITNVGGAMSLGTISGVNRALTLNNGSGAVTLRGATLGSLTRIGTGTLTLRGGTYQVGSINDDLRLGDVTIGGTVGFATSATLGQVTLDSASIISSNAPRLTIGSIAGAGLALGFTGSNGSDIRVNGRVDAASLNSTANAFTLRLLGGGATTGSAAFANNGLLFMAGDFSFAGGIDATKIGDRTITQGSIGTTNKDIRIGAMTLSGDTVLSSGNADITLDGALEGSFALALNSAGKTMLNGAVGNAMPLGVITTDAAGTTELSSMAGRVAAQGLVVNDSLTVTGIGSGLIINAPVTLGTGSITLEGTQDVSFLQSITMGADQTVWTNGTGATLFGGTVTGKGLTINGQTTFAAGVTLDSLSADKVIVDSASDGKVTVKTEGAQDYTGTLTLRDETELAASNVALTGNLNVSDKALTITATLDARDSIIETTGGNITVTGAATLARTTTRTNGGNIAVGTVGSDGLGLDASTITTGAGSVTVNGTTSMTGSSSISSGTVASQKLAMTSKSSISASTAVTIDDTVTMADSTISGGPVTVKGAATMTDSSSITGSSEVRLDSSATMTKSTISGGSVTVKGAATMTDSSGITGSSEVRLDSSATMTKSTISGGSVTVNGAATMTDSSSITGSSEVRLDSSATMTKSTISGDGPVTIKDAAMLAGSSITGKGLVTVGGVSDLTLDSGIAGDSVHLKAAANLTDSTVSANGSLQIDGSAQIVRSTLTSPAGPVTLNGAATLSAATITTKGGAVTFGKDVLLTGKADVMSDKGAVTFSGKVEGQNQLTVNSTGETVFEGTVKVHNLTTDAGGTTRTGTSLTADQKLTIGDDLLLTGDATLTATTIELNGKATGAHRLTLDSPATILKGDIDVASLRTDKAGTTTLAPTTGTISIKATGAIDIGDTVTLAGGTTMTGQTITLAGPVDSNASASPQTLTLSSTDGANIIGNVGATTMLESLTVTGAATLGAGTAFTATTSKAQEFGGAVTLAANTTLTGGSLTLKGTVDSDGTARTLTLNSTGTTQLIGDAGVKSVLSALTTDTPGTTILGGGGLTTMRLQASGPVTFGDNVSLVRDVLLAVTGDLRFKGTVMADRTADGRDLVTNATGAVVFEAAVGTEADRQLASLTVNAATGTIAGDLTVTSRDARTAGSVQTASIHTTGSQTFNGKDMTLAGTLRASNANSGNILVNTQLQLAADSALTAGGNIGLARTVDGAGRSLDLTAVRTDLLGAVGGDGALRSLSVTGTASALNVTTTNNQRYIGATTLNGSHYQTSGGNFQIDGATSLGGTGNIQVTTGAGNAVFSGTLNGNRALRIDSSGVTRFNGIVGGDVALAALTTDVGGSTAIGGNASAITVRETLSWGETMALERDVTMAAREVIFTGSVWSNSTTPSSLAVNGATSVTFKNLVGVRDDSNRAGADRLQALRSLSVTGGKITIDTTATPTGMVIRTAGNLAGGAGQQSYGAALDITGGSVLFDTANAGAVPADESVVRNITANIVPGGDLMFSQMNASKADVTWFLGSGAVAVPGGTGLNPSIDVLSLRMVGVGGSATLTGSVAGVTGGVAAQRVRKQLPRSNDYRLNDCAMGSPTCIVTSVPALPVPQSVSRPDFPEPPRLEEEDVRRVSRGNEDLW